MLYDTLTYNGVEKTFVSWGFTNDLKGSKKNQGDDLFTCTIGNTTIVAEASNPTFAFEGSVIVRVGRTLSNNSFSGGSIKFQGKRVGQPCKANSSGHGVTYKFKGPWYDLSETNYQQTFVGAGGVSYLIPEIFLFTSLAAGVPLGTIQIYCSVGDQIQAILQWLLDQYQAQGMAAPYQYVGRDLNSGVIDLNSTNGTYNYHVNSATTISLAFYSLFYPTFITKPIMCAEALKKCLELSPRANIWFDYTTTPPTVHVSLPADQVPVTLPLFDGSTHQDISITRRDDLFVRSVNLLYRYTATVNNQPEVSYIQDKWGPNGSNSNSDPNTGLRVLNDMLDLQGFAETTTKAHLDVEPVAATADMGGVSQTAKRNWWALKRGGEFSKLDDSRVRFQDKNGAQTTIPDGVITNAATNQQMSTADLIAYGLCNKAGQLQVNRLVRGTCHAWMSNLDGSPVVSLKVRILATMTYAEYDCTSSATNPDTDTTTGVALKKSNSEDHHVNIEITNGLTGAYSTLASFTQGEAYIIGNGGIAQYLYNHLNAYQYDGEVVHVLADFSNPGAAEYVTLGNTLNLSNGVAEWASMNAQIQSINEDYYKHQTSIQIGVAKHLNAGQLSSMLNMWYNRRPWYNPLLRSNNSLGSSADEVDQAITSGNGNSVPGLLNNGLTGNVDYVNPPSGSTPGTIGGLINNDPSQVTKVLAAASPTPTLGFSATDVKTMQPREVCLLDSNGNQVYSVIHMTATYTKA